MGETVLLVRKLSQWHDVISGIPKGSIIGPLLFIIYINDLPDFFKDLYTRLFIYADDTKLYRHILNGEDYDNQQNDIHMLKNWAGESLLKLNVEKCYGMTYSHLCNYRYYIVNCNVQYELTKVDSVNDLGVRFDSKLAFLDHMNDKVYKAYSV